MQDFATELVLMQKYYTQLYSETISILKPKCMLLAVLRVNVTSHSTTAGRGEDDPG